MWNTLPSEIRQACRDGTLDTPTPGLAPGYVQANLVVLPQSYAYDFLLFCQLNPKPCPLLDVTDRGNPEPKRIAPNADIRTDLPRYQVFRKGEWVEETKNISAHWQGDLVAFLIGCSFSFEAAMLNAGLTVRHIEEEKNVPMYKTTIATVPSGIFSGPMVVSMRPLPAHQVLQSVEVTRAYYRAHGAPIHIGDPAAIGIHDLACPDYGDAVTIREGEVPVFWACGVTAQTALLQAKTELAITHAPGHMFVSDLMDKDVLLS
ncbi:putative hydro-lyase [Synechococcales cyanobacterium C]|uniref:Putative hydro-lyase n=1 Tax=Petrachloros mirabilis ULC683 TaxID=2781853 RepID=A0A8K2A7I8_9CYAN|nr:putative hydro-lyase [Petrachloros mirabilis]NCJ06130.1 putative hydro-lyase [Petrachloros mirabilis ULC683]